VIPKAPAPGLDPSGQPHDQEARLLAQLLRTSPLSVLYAEGGADKTALLRLALMPYLARRASDKLAPVAVRASGVVVPFPDRRGRAAPRAAKRRREIVVYLDDWSRAPLGALREALDLATATARTEPLAPSMRLGEILGEVSRRMDAHLIVLLDRFEELVKPASESPGRIQFVNEFAEAVALPGLPASFLIALEEEARPRLASLRARIPGFDDFSLKVAPPRDFKAPATPRIVKSAEPVKPSSAVAIEALPVLTDKLAAPPPSPEPSPPATSMRTVQPPRRTKAKDRSSPKAPVTTADVHDMIAEALSRITATRVRLDPESPTRSRSGLAPSPTDARAQSSARVLQKAIERMEQRLGLPPEDGQT